MPTIVATATGFPPYYYSQEAVTAELRRIWQKHHTNVGRLERLHERVQVGGRHLALPLEAYRDLGGFGESNAVWREVATDVGEKTLRALFEQSPLAAADVSLFAFTTVTGVAVPSIDARLMNRLPFARNVKRLPLFGLGCLGGAAGVARIADYLRGAPNAVALLLAVELCSLTLQPDDLSIANIIASGLFGDGAAAVLMVGRDHPLARSAPPGRTPSVVDSCSVFFPDSEEVMGWEIVNEGFKLVLSADVPEIAQNELRPAVEAFLAQHNLTIETIGCWIAHPGGPKVMEGLQTGLGLASDALRLSWESLERIGNVSSASVLFVLDETLARVRPVPGTYGVMLAMGPAFCAELVLLQW